MSRAFKCDRCQEFYDPESEDGNFAKINEMTRYDGASYRECRYSVKDADIDLCPKCLHSFDIWMNAPTEANQMYEETLRKLSEMSGRDSQK